MDTPLPKNSILRKYSTWEYYLPTLTIRMYYVSTCSQPCSWRNPCPAHVKDYSRSRLWNLCSSLWNTQCNSHPQFKLELPADGAACKKAEKTPKHLSLGFPADMKSVITNLPEDPELRSKSINPTSASDNQWTWLAGSGLAWIWKQCSMVITELRWLLLFFSFDFSHDWKDVTI